MNKLCKAHQQQVRNILALREPGEVIGCDTCDISQALKEVKQKMYPGSQKEKDSSMRKPVVTVSESSDTSFEARCATLVKQGYKLVCASGGFVDSEKYDFCDSWQAVFALPEFLSASFTSIKNFVFDNSALCNCASSKVASNSTTFTHWICPKHGYQTC